LLESGKNIRTVQEQLGHNDVRTTMIYINVLGRDANAVRSPLVQLPEIGRQVPPRHFAGKST